MSNNYYQQPQNQQVLQSVLFNGQNASPGMGHAPVGVGGGTGGGSDLEFFSGSDYGASYGAESGGAGPFGGIGDMGTFGSSAPSSAYAYQGSSSSAFDAPGTLGSSTSFDDEPPLLEELGISPEHIMKKTLNVINPRRPVQLEIVMDNDLAGPLVFLVGLGFALLLTGKVHFGWIYGFFMVGCITLFLLLNLMSETGIDLVAVMSLLGYALLPIVLLAAVSIIIDLRGMVGMVLGPFCILWCTLCATRFCETALEMRNQRWLVAYPLLLFYSLFAMITVF